MSSAPESRESNSAIKSGLDRYSLSLVVLGTACLLAFALLATWKIAPLLVLTLYLGGLFLLVGLLLIFARRQMTLLANILLILVLLLVVEIVCFFILGMPIAYNENFDSPDYPPDHIYRNVGKLIDANTVYNHVRNAEGKLIFDVEYSIDAKHQRITPPPSFEPKEYAIFFGGSFAFGYGLEDDETIAYQFQEQSGFYRGYNFGYTGHSANHMLARLEFSDLSRQVKEEDGIAIYVFIWDHIDRVVGSMKRYTEWLSNAPYYVLEKDDLVRKGMFNTDRVLVSRFYELVYQSSILKLLEIDFPFRINEGHKALASEIIVASRDLYAEQFGNDNFYVAIYPSGAIDYEPEELQQFESILISKGIKTIDLTELTELERKHRIPGDFHPRAETHATMAGELLKRLGR